VSGEERFLPPHAKRKKKDKQTRTPPAAIIHTANMACFFSEIFV
jgi:hypothetical protein